MRRVGEPQNQHVCICSHLLAQEEEPSKRIADYTLYGRLRHSSRHQLQRMVSKWGILTIDSRFTNGFWAPVD